MSTKAWYGFRPSDRDCIQNYDKKGVLYRGRTSVTKSGKICQNWDVQSPNKHHLITPKRLVFSFSVDELGFLRGITAETSIISILVI